jgi:MFS family permease
MQSIPVPFQTSKTNIYAILSLIEGGLAFLSNCISLLMIVIPAVPFVCGVASGMCSLGALVTGMVGLVQVKREGNMQKGKGLAIAGIILGVLGLIGACLIPLLGTALLATFGLQIGNMLLVPAK